VTLSVALFLSDEEDPKRFATAAPIIDTPIVDEPPPQEAAKSSKAPRKPVKKVVVVRSSSRVKKLSRCFS
jgi:hypothetical protein